MSKTVMVINGTTRGNGNTDILVNKLIEGANNAGVNITLIELRKKEISNCIGCYHCVKEAKCSLQDDMTGIRADIEKAAWMVFASPLYWWGVTGLMKTFIDRLFFYYYRRNRGLIAGKKAIMITPLAENNPATVADLMTEFYKRLWNRLEVDIAEMAFFGGLMEKGAVLQRQEHLEKAFAIGKELTKWLED
jgi:multimeric flavodoxin WrbA